MRVLLAQMASQFSLENFWLGSVASKHPRIHIAVHGGESNWKFSNFMTRSTFGGKALVIESVCEQFSTDGI